MFIMRWLMTRPIAFVWALTVLALLLGYQMDSGEGHSETTEQHVAAKGVVKAEEAASATSEDKTASTDDSGSETASTEGAEVVTEDAVTSTGSDATESEAKELATVTTEGVADDTTDNEEIAVSDVVATDAEVVSQTTEVADVAAVTMSVIDQAKATEVKTDVAEAAVSVIDQAKETTVEVSTEQVVAVEEIVTQEVTVDDVEQVAVITEEMAVPEVATTTEAVELTDQVTAEQIATEQAATQAQAAVTAQAPAQAILALAPADLLRYARGAYWAGDLNSSVQYYQQLVEQQPDVIDFQGELANVYWRQGASEKAAALYADMALPMIEMGKTQQVKTMNIFIGQYLPEKAKEIAAKLQP